jgi:hypothetical protein
LPKLPVSAELVQLEAQLLAQLKVAEAEYEKGKSERRYVGGLRLRLDALRKQIAYVLPEMRRQQKFPAHIQLAYDSQCNEYKRLLALKKQYKQDAKRYALDVQQYTLDAKQYPQIVARLKQAWKQKCADIDRQWGRRLAKSSRGEIDEIQRRSLQRIRADFNGLTSPVIYGQIQRMPWRFLPAPEPGIGGLDRFLEHIRNSWPDLRIDEARLRFACDLNPSHICIGSDDFRGYLAFIFESTNNVLLESPMEGNAAYVFRENWKVLSRLSKTELLRLHPTAVGRVIHRLNSDWRARLHSMLKT